MSKARVPATASSTAGGARLWPDAAGRALRDLTGKVRKAARKIERDADTDGIHDMRTATRRLRTAIGLYRDVTPGKRRRRVGRELRRVARRLGTVRDLDVLIRALDDSLSGGPAGARPGLQALRDAWADERAACAARLARETERRRFARSIDASTGLGRGLRSGRRGTGRQNRVAQRVANRAPELVWAAFGNLLAYEIDPRTADPSLIHEMRIAAKRLRYTLEAFEEAFDQVGPLASEVTGLQDAAGDMHDAIVAAERARSFRGSAKLDADQRRDVKAFATAQERRADQARETVSSRLSAVRGESFRLALTAAVSGCSPGSAGRPA